MPAIVNPHRGLPLDTPPATRHSRSSDSAFVALRTLLRRRELTRLLAQGVDPNARPELTRRAVQLTGARNRKVLVRTLRRTLAEARTPDLTRARVVIVNRRAVIEAEEAITTMIGLLGSALPVHAQGVAIAERMLSNEDRSPLYNESAPGELRRLISSATDAMKRDDATSHEFPLAA